MEFYPLQLGLLRTPRYHACLLLLHKLCQTLWLAWAEMFGVFVVCCVLCGKGGGKFPGADNVIIWAGQTAAASRQGILSGSRGSGQASSRAGTKCRIYCYFWRIYNINTHCVILSPTIIGIVGVIFIGLEQQVG